MKTNQIINQQSAGNYVCTLFKREDLTRFANCPYMVESKLLTPKGKYQKEKILKRYVFKTELEANEYLTKYVSNILTNIQSREDAKNKAKQHSENLKASEHFKVGDIIVNTWGWEQTNTEFYQVTEVKNKMIVVSAIYQKDVDGSHGFMCCDVMPDIDNFILEGHFAKTYNLRLKSTSNGDVLICNPKSFYYFHKWSGKAQYSSHYA